MNDKNHHGVVNTSRPSAGHMLGELALLLAAALLIAACGGGDQEATPAVVDGPVMTGASTRSGAALAPGRASPMSEQTRQQRGASR